MVLVAIRLEEERTASQEYYGSAVFRAERLCLSVTLIEMLRLRLGSRHSLEVILIADGKAEPFRTECGKAAE